MLARRTGSLSLVVAALACPACQTVTRAGEDAMVVGTFPIHAVTTPYKETASRVRHDGASPWVSPIIFAGHFAEDVGVTMISAGDLGISPAFGFVELVSGGDEKVRPLRMYSFDKFPPEFRKHTARAVESDVAEGAAQAAVVVVFVGAFCAAAYYGGPGNYTDVFRGLGEPPPPPPSPRRTVP